MQLSYDIRTVETSQIKRTLYDSCPLCECPSRSEEKRADASKHPIWRPEFEREMRWVRCHDCQHVFTDGYYGGDALTELLDKVQSNQAPGVDVERHRTLSADMVERVIRAGATVGSWLDVGCGNGALVATASEFGFRAKGIDLRAYIVDSLKAFGIDAESRELGAVSGTFDVVSMCDVVEHVAFPKELLKQAHERLNSGGFLFLSCPAADSPVWRMLGDANPYWWEIEHFHNFSRERLYALLRECGFEPLSYGISKRYRVGMEIVARRCDA